MCSHNHHRAPFRTPDHPLCVVVLYVSIHGGSRRTRPAPPGGPAGRRARVGGEPRAAVGRDAGDHHLTARPARGVGNGARLHRAGARGRRSRPHPCDRLHRDRGAVDRPRHPAAARVPRGGVAPHDERRLGPRRRAAHVVARRVRPRARPHPQRRGRGQQRDQPAAQLRPPLTGTCAAAAVLGRVAPGVLRPRRASRRRCSSGPRRGAGGRTRTRRR
ncbi:hypothetical protein FRIGORI9N_400038 [Frigoribacterium sp. 9N]|nr:hypothetical protein FRIGORI9N_400038 [Frigoribacterium sp. 9N]